jgi:hypothetical protein
VISFCLGVIIQFICESVYMAYVLKENEIPISAKDLAKSLWCCVAVPAIPSRDSILK